MVPKGGPRYRVSRWFALGYDFVANSSAVKRRSSVQKRFEKVNSCRRIGDDRENLVYFVMIYFGRFREGTTTFLTLPKTVPRPDLYRTYINISSAVNLLHSSLLNELIK